MKFQYASDLHLEFPENRAFLKTNPLQPAGDVLLLAGDIIPFRSIEDVPDFFSYLSDHFRATYWIPGNHEYYHFDASMKSGTFKENIRSNVFLLNNSSVIEGQCKLIFSTLWSKISEHNQWRIERGLNDFRVIKYLGNHLPVPQYNKFHRDSLAFISKELADNAPELKKVVVSHHAPTFQNYPPEYLGDALNEAFATDLDWLIESTHPDYWLYGHHHRNIPEFKIGNTGLITNQLGYVRYGEHHQFEHDKTISF